MMVDFFLPAFFKTWYKLCYNNTDFGEGEKRTEEAANISSVLKGEGSSFTFADLYMCFDGIFVIFKNYLRLYFMQQKKINKC